VTIDDLISKSEALESLRAEWAKSILSRVDAKLADSLAHAERAVTRTLKATSDGRPTARKASQSPSYAAAVSRLDELWVWLAGPSKDSLSGRLRDAREAFYKRAFELHRELVPTELHVSADPEPTFANIRLVRGALIHGFDLRRELEGPFSTAKRKLAAAVANAGQRSATVGDSSDILETWHRQSLAAIQTAVLRALSDSAEFADTEAGMDLIHPDYLED
jgi:hypothetical protein